MDRYKHVDAAIFASRLSEARREKGLSQVILYNLFLRAVEKAVVKMYRKQKSRGVMPRLCCF